MGVIKDKVTGWIKKATETATDTVKQITKEDAANTLDILGDLAKIGIFTVLTIGAFKATSAVSTTSKVVQTVAAADVLEPIVHTAQAAAPVVQIFLGEGKGVHIE